MYLYNRNWVCGCVLIETCSLFRVSFIGGSTVDVLRSGGKKSNNFGKGSNPGVVPESPVHYTLSYNSQIKLGLLSLPP